MSDNNFFGGLGIPDPALSAAGPMRARVDHPAYDEVNDSAATFYPMAVVTLPPAPDVPPEGDRYAFATWRQETTAYKYFNFIPWGYAATNAPIATEQDNMRIGRSLVNPSL